MEIFFYHTETGAYDIARILCHSHGKGDYSGVSNPGESSQGGGGNLRGPSERVEGQNVMRTPSGLGIEPA